MKIYYITRNGLGLKIVCPTKSGGGAIGLKFGILRLIVPISSLADTDSKLQFQVSMKIASVCPSCACKTKGIDNEIQQKIPFEKQVRLTIVDRIMLFTVKSYSQIHKTKKALTFPQTTFAQLELVTK